MITTKNKALDSIKAEIRRLLADVTTLDEMRELNMVLNERWNEIQAEQARGAIQSLNLRAGARVKFTDSRTGRVVHGTVEKVNRKSIKVREDGRVDVGGGMKALPLVWSVAPSILQRDDSPQTPAEAGPPDDEIDLIISKCDVFGKPIEPERIKTIYRHSVNSGNFKASEWSELLKQAREHAIFATSGKPEGDETQKRYRIQGGECHKELAGTYMGGCGEFQVVRIYTRRASPEVVVFRNRCLNCAKEDEDVAD